MTIKGRPISKKRAYLRSKNGGLYLDSNYKNWRAYALLQLKKYKEKYTSDLAVTYTFQVKGRALFDLDNAVVGINDILQDAGILANDRQIIHITANKYYGFEEFVTIVDIEEKHTK